mmetsp:Transcript_115182/g.325453  ORF Transcript_115182/g.325453 Transcript_115182/m.325453 type:complete len:221 (-) Transcript_115182:288-950(-)
MNASRARPHWCADRAAAAIPGIWMQAAASSHHALQTLRVHGDTDPLRDVILFAISAIEGGALTRAVGIEGARGQVLGDAQQVLGPEGHELRVLVRTPNDVHEGQQRKNRSDEEVRARRRACRRQGDVVHGLVPPMLLRHPIDIVHPIFARLQQRHVDPVHHQIRHKTPDLPIVEPRDVILLAIPRADDSYDAEEQTCEVENAHHELAGICEAARVGPVDD